MNWRETFRTALEAISHRRLRSGLTVLGILIGIAAVILTVGLGKGAQEQVAAQINALGSNLLIVSPGSTTSSTGLRGGQGSATTLTTADAQLLSDKKIAPDVAAAAPVSSTSTSLDVGTSNWTTQVTGTTTAWPDVRQRTVASGRFFSDDDVTNARPVMVIGSSTAEELFSAQSAVGQTVTVSGQTFTIIGELAEQGSSSTTDEDDLALIPLTTYFTRLSPSSGQSVSQIYVEATGEESLSAAYQEVQNALLTSHRVTESDADFSVTSQQSIVETATETSRTLTVLLGGIAAISLLVGAIGVMNIMLVSVTERVKEIGLRKALGATPRVILRQFLVEASVLGLIGGVIGLLLGYLGARVLPSLIDQPVTISTTAALGALAVSVLIGIIAGVYPASRAARLAPIDALRSE